MVRSDNPYLLSVKTTAAQTISMHMWSPVMSTERDSRFCQLAAAAEQTCRVQGGVESKQDLSVRHFPSIPDRDHHVVELDSKARICRWCARAIVRLVVAEVK
jgi:hypothetical protein